MDMRAGQAPANEIRPTYGYAGSRGQLTGDEVVGALTQIGREHASVRQRQGPLLCLSCLTWGREGDQLGHRAIVAEELRDPGPHTQRFSGTSNRQEHDGGVPWRMHKPRAMEEQRRWRCGRRYKPEGGQSRAEPSRADQEPSST